MTWETLPRRLMGFLFFPFITYEPPLESPIHQRNVSDNIYETQISPGNGGGNPPQRSEPALSWAGQVCTLQRQACINRPHSHHSPRLQDILQMSQETHSDLLGYIRTLNKRPWPPTQTQAPPCDNMCLMAVRTQAQHRANVTLLPASVPNHLGFPTTNCGWLSKE